MKYKKLLIILSIVALSLTGCGAKIAQTADTLTIEAGSELSFQVSDFFESNKSEALNECLVDTTAVDTSKVGTYQIIVGYNKDRYSVTVNVKDTTAPIITPKEQLPEVKIDVPIKASDFVDVTDSSDYTVYFVQENEKNEETVFLSESSSLNIGACDASGNESEITLEISTVTDDLALPGNVTNNQDGTYTVTENWYGALTNYNEFFSDISDKDMYILLDIIIGMKGEDASGDEVREILDIYIQGAGSASTIGQFTGSTKKEETTNNNNTSNGTAQQPSNGNTSEQQSSSNNNGGGGQSQAPAPEQTQPSGGSSSGGFDPSKVQVDGWTNETKDISGGTVDIPDNIVLH